MDTKHIQQMIEHRGKNRIRLYDVYRLLYNRNVYPNKTNKDIVDVSIDELKSGRFNWTGIRTKHLTSDGRFVETPSAVEKAVAGAIRQILDWYYEPRFSLRNHGFRPHKGPRTAISYIKRWDDVEWFKHYDITNCFPSIRFSNLCTNSDFRDIQDKRMLELIEGLTINGLPVGSPLSPLLCNVFLNSMDIYSPLPYYCRYADNILIGGDNVNNRDMLIQGLVASLYVRSLSCHDKGNTFLSVNLSLVGNKIMVTRPDEYEPTMIGYYEGLGV